MNEKDKQIANDIIERFVNDGAEVDIPHLRSDIVDALSTVRREAKQAALTEAVKAGNVSISLSVNGDESYKRGYKHGALNAQRAILIQLEAAANSVPKADPELDLARVQMEAHNQHHE